MFIVVKDMKDPLRREKRAKSVAQSPISGMDGRSTTKVNRFNHNNESSVRKNMI